MRCRLRRGAKGPPPPGGACTVAGSRSARRGDSAQRQSRRYETPAAQIQKAEAQAQPKGRTQSVFTSAHEVESREGAQPILTSIEQAQDHAPHPALTNRSPALLTSVSPEAMIAYADLLGSGLFHRSCARICARDAAGQVVTGEMEQHGPTTCAALAEVTAHIGDCVAPERRAS